MLDDYYVPVDKSTYQRIKDVKKSGPEFIEPGLRYALPNIRHRPLLTSNIPNGPKIAYDSFIWCSRLARPLEDVLNEKLFVHNPIGIPFYPGLALPRYGLIRICPKYANGCYIIDNAIYNTARDNIIYSIKPRKVLTYDEQNSIDLLRANTIVPIGEYNGDYEQPILLINRELDFDEVELAGVFTT